MLKSSISIIFIVLFMQGCFDIDLKLDVQEDGKANITGHYDFARLVSMQEKMEGHSNLNCEKIGNTSRDMTDCSEYTKGIFDATWMNKDLEKDGSLLVERSFFITTYTLDVGRFLNDFGTNSLINKKLSLRKVGAKYQIDITMPGQINPNYELAIHDNVVTVDAVDILDDHKEIVVVSQAYNKLSILGAIGSMIALIIGLISLIAKKKRHEEKVICKKCGVENKNSSTFCTGCNTALMGLKRDEESLPSQDEAMIICKKCGSENKNGDSFCKECGDSLLEQNHDEALPLPQDDSMVVCKKCGTENKNGDSFCRGCGGSLLEVESTGNVANVNTNKKVWFSIIAVAVGIFLIAIVLKMSNNNDDYTTEAAPAATEEVAPAAEISYREAMPFTTNNYYELTRRVKEIRNNQKPSGNEVYDQKRIFRDTIEAMGFDFDKTLLAFINPSASSTQFDKDYAVANPDPISAIGDAIGAVLAFEPIFNSFKNTVIKHPDESVSQGFVSEETKNIIVGAEEERLQKSKEQADAAALKSAWESVPASDDQKVKSSSEDAQKAEAVVNTWSEAHNTQDLNSFSQVFASKVKFYGKELTANKVIDEKIRVLEKYPNFYQEIIGDITCNMENQSSAYRCEFTKRVTFGKKEKDYPSYLVIDTSSQEPKITVESDHITDRNLK